MIIEHAVVGEFMANCFVLGCEETHECLLLDPGAEPDRIAEILERNGLKPVVYFHTHAHIDHVGATAPLKERFGGEIVLHKDDLFLYQRADEIAAGYGIRIPPTVEPDRFIADGETIRWGTLEGRVIHTPGHSPGGICLLIEQPHGARLPAGLAGAVRSEAGSGPWVFTGDTIFAGSVGRTDFPGGSMDQLVHSIRARILSLPEDTLLLPGHGPATTVGYERRNNPFVGDQ